MLDSYGRQLIKSSENKARSSLLLLLSFAAYLLVKNLLVDWHFGWLTFLVDRHFGQQKIWSTDLLVDRHLVYLHFGQQTFWSTDILVNRHFGKQTFGLLTFWSTNVLVHRHFGQQTFWSTNIFIYTHFGRQTFWSANILVNRHFGQKTFWSTGILVDRHFGAIHFGQQTFWSTDIFIYRHLVNRHLVNRHFGQQAFWLTDILFNKHSGQQAFWSTGIWAQSLIKSTGVMSFGRQLIVNIVYFESESTSCESANCFSARSRRTVFFFLLTSYHLSMANMLRWLYIQTIAWDILTIIFDHRCLILSVTFMFYVIFL